MGKKPDLSKFETKFKKGNDFKISRAQYIQMTGIDIPQDKYYTQNNSSVAKRAREFGYTVTVIPEQLIFKKQK